MSGKYAVPAEPEVPEAIKDLIPPAGMQDGPMFIGITPQEVKRTTAIAMEAYRRGQNSK